MKKIGVFSDTHGNLNALNAVLKMFDEQNVDEIIHCGDVISIGPDSKECLKLLLETKNCTLVLGNHDLDFIEGRNAQLPQSHISSQHKTFVFNSIDDEFRQKLSKCPLVVYRKHNDLTFTFCHYALREDLNSQHFKFMPLEPHPTAEKFDKLFEFTSGDVIFFGHKHEPIDIFGKRTYIDVGSIGCHPKAVARAVVLTFCDDGRWNFQRIEAPYDRNLVHKKMVESNLPDGQYVFDFYFDRLYSKDET